MRKPHPSTLAVRAGETRDPATGSINVPIYRSSGFAPASVDDLEDLLSGKRQGPIYSRRSNPTDRAVELKLAALEGADDGVMFASGMAAIASALLANISAGQGMLTLKESYGGTKNLERRVLRRLGLDVRELTVADLARLPDMVWPECRLLFLESPTNPLLKVIDLATVCAEARRLGLLTVVDNTFATPINQRPLELGADLVVHSATKYLGGHSDLIAGVALGSREACQGLRTLRADLGGNPDPETAYLLCRSMKTLPLRMEAHNRNALALATFLSGHPTVEQVYYPGLPQSPDHAIAQRQMAGFGGMVSFRHGGGAQGARAFLDRVALPFLPTLGGVESSVTIPALTSHRLLSAQEKASLAIDEALVRISVGIEHIDDIIEDVKEALHE